MDRRRYLAEKHVRGHGIEIGALHRPVPVGDGVVVKYVDYKSTELNRARYPELSVDHIAETDIVDNGFLLSTFSDHSLDFIIANHLLEHSPDPIGTLYVFQKKLRNNGILFLAVPRLDQNYDLGRPLTPIEHLTQDREMFMDPVNSFDAIVTRSRAHLVEFLTISDGNIRKLSNGEPAFSDPTIAENKADQILSRFRVKMREAQDRLASSENSQADRESAYRDIMDAHVYDLNLIYDIHYHTFSPDSFKKLFDHLEKEAGGNLRLEEMAISGIGEVIAVARNTTVT